MLHTLRSPSTLKASSAQPQALKLPYAAILKRAAPGDLVLASLQVILRQCVQKNEQREPLLDACESGQRACLSGALKRRMASCSCTA